MIVSNLDKERLLRSTILAGFFAAGLAATPAMAQESDEPATTQSEEDGQQAASDDRIVVTGSRIRREGIDTFYPAISVDAQVLEDGAFANVADALNEIPTFGNPDATPVGGQNAFSTGQNFVDFLGLGAQRTLTLVDGRRFVSQNVPSSFGETGGLQVDFNVIPIALVERIETIGVGGTPIYGSDAIAGTINVITRDSFEGLQATAQYGWMEDGAGEESLVSMVAGGNFNNDRGNVTASLEFFVQDAMSRRDRPEFYSPENNPDFLTVRGATPADNRETIFFDRRISILSNTGLIGSTDGAACASLFGFGSPCLIPSFAPAPIWGAIGGGYWSFDADGNVVSYDGGQADPESFFWQIGGDGDSFTQDTAQLRSPLERLVATTGINYEITNNIRFSSDFLFANSSADELVNQGGFQTFAFGGTSGALTFDTDHPLLTQNARDFFTQQGLSQFVLHRFQNDLIDSSNSREQHVWRFTAGFEGEFEFAGRDFFWETFVVHGESDAETRGEMIIDGRFLNAIDVVRLTAADITAAGGSDAILAFSGTDTANAGDVVCRASLEAALGTRTGFSGNGVTDSDLPFTTGCVPLNLFGSQISQEARDWVTGTTMSQSDIEQTVYNANFGGDLFDLPAGPLSFVVGFEAREERAAYVSEAASAIALGRSAALVSTGGRYSTNEIYGETLIPLISPDMDLPFMHFAELNAAVREIDNSQAGDSTVWTAGGRFAPVEDITFRGNYTEALRAPSLVELFAPITGAFASADDPCDTRFVNTGRVPATRLANCQADLGPSYDPTAFTSTVVNATARGRTGGNPNLLNETSEAFAVGVTIEPRWIDNLTLTVDYVSINIFDAITSLSLETLMEACYDSPNFPAAECSSFTRNAANQVVDFQSGQTNAATFEVASVDYAAFYNFDIADAVELVYPEWAQNDLGNLAISARVTNERDRATSVAGEPPSQVIGGYGTPEWSGLFDFTWTKDNWRAFWRTNWQAASDLDPAGDLIFLDQNGNEIAETDMRFIHSASLSYSFDSLFAGAPNDTIVQFSVNNIFDRDPNVVEEAAGHFNLTDEVYGRTFRLRVRAVY